MIKIDLSSVYPKLDKFSEFRIQENRSMTMVYENGNLVGNDKSSRSGVSARVFKDGVWGFASKPEINNAAIDTVLEKAKTNAVFLASQEDVSQTPYESKSLKVSKDYSTRKRKLSQNEFVTYLKNVDNYICATYPDLTSRTIILSSWEVEKQLITSDQTESYCLWPRASIYINFIAMNDGEPTELYKRYGGIGNLEDYLTSLDDIKDDLEILYQSLQKKITSVHAKTGVHDVVLDAEITGLLAHEAMGHTAEADYVRKGSIAGDYLNEQVASPLISLYDFGHTFNNETVPVPMFVDDEGSICKDAHIIEKGILKSLMHNRDSAYEFDHENTGNGRANEFSDEPNIRMRNTAILPGNSKLEELIASIDDGYYFKKSSDGEADITGEFMFGIVEGYEIKNGKLGKAIKDTTISGKAFDVLSSVTMVSDEMKWSTGGWCYRKTLIPVGMGGPAIKCRINVGGK